VFFNKTQNTQTHRFYCRIFIIYYYGAVIITIIIIMTMIILVIDIIIIIVMLPLTKRTPCTCRPGVRRRLLREITPARDSCADPAARVDLIK